MLRLRDLSLPPDYTREQLNALAAKKLRVPPKSLSGLRLLKKSIDARKQEVKLILTVAVSVPNEAEVLKKCREAEPYVPYRYLLPEKRQLPRPPVVVGMGPAGLFAALILAQAGACPVILERGRDVDSRTRAVEAFQNGGPLDEESNVQFGEGGAGTFSDGKLNTGTKDPRIRKVLEEFVQSGAPEDILTDAKPHIGTDVLRHVIKDLRRRIVALGGTVHFGARFCGFSGNGAVKTVQYIQDGRQCALETEHLVLAVGHSARDVFRLLYDSGVAMEARPFPVGVRIEHLQADIDAALYGRWAGHPRLGAASYNLAVHPANGRSLHTFCMCPGGQVVAATSLKGHVVTNGMSLHARDGANANSALLVSTQVTDYGSDHPLAGVAFQQRLEHTAFRAGGGTYAAPCCRWEDFSQGRRTAAFGEVVPTYRPGVTPDDLGFLPDFVAETLRLGIPLMGRKLPGFDSPDALLTGVESRTTSPVRLLRGQNFMSVSHPGLYPCGEGAGFAGGIVSAAVDGIRCAESILRKDE